MTQLPAVANTMPDLQAEIPAKNQMVTKDMPDTSGFRDVLNEASTPHSEPEVPREPTAPGAKLRPGASDEGAELLPAGGNASPLEEAALQKLAVPGVPVLAVSGTVTSDGPAHVAPQPTQRGARGWRLPGARAHRCLLRRFSMLGALTVAHRSRRLPRPCAARFRRLRRVRRQGRRLFSIRQRQACPDGISSMCNTGSWR